VNLSFNAVSAVYVGGEKLSADVLSPTVSHATRLPTTLAFEIKCSATVDVSLFGLLPGDPKADIEIRFPRVPTTHLPMGRVTKSGRLVYGGAPRLGPRFYTAGGKLERRRVRSRLAALTRRLTPRPPIKLDAATITASELRKVMGGVEVDVMMTSMPTVVPWNAPARTVVARG
jgi:hypothetical protein